MNITTNGPGRTKHSLVIKPSPQKHKLP